MAMAEPHDQIQTPPVLEDLSAATVRRFLVQHVIAAVF